MRVGESTNEFGTPISVHVCDACGGRFTCCPAIPAGNPHWENCLAVTCPSYDITRDIDLAWDLGVAGGIVRSVPI